MDNVYEVTIVAIAAGGRDELPVTVKVINSTDDNAPGSVTFSIRQPEVAIRFEAKFEDMDGPISGTVNWQWYRAAVTSTQACTDAVRMPTTSDDHRAFIADPTEETVGGELVEQITIADGGGTWTKIPDANGTGIIARYTPEAVFTTDDQGNPTTTHADDSDFSKCLRATFTYRDDVDRTYSGANDTTTDVDETLEGTWAAPEQPVKAIDENNEAPVFTFGGTIAGELESTYRSRVVENADGGIISEAFAAVDPPDGEDDATADLLMYSLSGRDMGAFLITGTLDDDTPNQADDDGVLTFNVSANYEVQDEYRVTITATDPGGDSGSVDVIVDVSDVNERPSLVGAGSSAYDENRTDPVSTFNAVDPEGSGITYSLQTEPIIAVADDGSGAIEEVLAPAYADAARFEIGPVNGELTFKASPNFEDPDDADTNNTYLVTVRAEVADDTNPRHFATQQVTVTVDDVNEAPMFSDTTQPLQITENPDDQEKEPPLTRGDNLYLYLLNRGAGIPSPANPPAAPNLDVGLPVVAIDDDNNGDDPISISDGGSAVQLPDAVTYELSGADAGYFDIVPATGQILTVKKLDYEAKNEFKVTVKASDVEGLSDTIDMTINVLDVDEVPVPDVLRITGKSSHEYAENDTKPVGKYKVAAGGDATPGAWILEGADASSFRLTGSGTTRMLEFRSSPDYDANSDNMYEVTLKVTDSINSETYDTFAVTVTVTNVDELGVLSGPASASVNEGDTDLGTYELTAIEDGPAVTWSLDGTDMSDFMLEGTGMSRMLKFSSAPDYENPMGGANDDSNTYMVTVMAEAGGEMEMVAVTITVDNAEEAGAVTLNPTRPSVGTAITATLADADIVETVSWQWASADAMDGNFAGITGATDASYTPVDADANMWLRAMATYTDGFDSGNDESAVSASAVSQVAVNVAPAFPSATATRSIAENTAANTNIGAPVAATDPNGDTLAYSLEGTDEASFSVGSGTGQLRTRAALNFETKTDYTVVVKATDPDGLFDTIDVNINVTDVVEVVPEVPAIVDEYDSNKDGDISIAELFVAIDDYFDGGISIAELFEVIDAYFG